MERVLLQLIFTFSIMTWSYGQTLIMNEVSNGPAGNQEYVEFVVVSDAVSYDCNGSTPPCIDIRGWIFDDNSGYHTVGQGVAPGAVRFANVPLWSCLPLGTIIVIYNNAETNTSIPGPDVTMADGNCRLIVPLNDPAYFEFNATTPGDVACSYPASGWGTDPSPTWASNTALANTGDCARIVDLSGCEVFSVCYAAADSNNLIYFASGGSGTDNVWYFNNGNPNDQLNWTEGCADPAACGANLQTPGAPNNAANAAYIAQFNNGCAPITPVTGTALVDNHEQCGCDGQATAAGAGSIGPYTYEWFDATMTPIAQNSATATGLCPGTYFVTVTSSIDCDVTETVMINPGIGNPVFTTSFTNPTSCGASNGTITLTGLNPSTGYSLTYTDDGTPIGPLAITTTAGGTYVITGLNSGGYSSITISNGSCSSLSASVSLSDPSSPVFSISLISNPSTCGGTDGAIHLEGTGTLSPSTVYALTYTDSGTGVGPVNITTDANGDYDITGLNAGSYTSFVLNLAGCVGSQPGPITLVDPTPPTATAGTTTPTICNGSSINLTANTVPGATYSWTGPNTFNSSAEDPIIASATTAASGTYTLTITLNNCVSLPSNVAVTVNATPVLSITNPAPVCTPSTVNITAAAVTAGSTAPGILSYWTDMTATTPLATPSAVSVGGTYYIQANNAGCTDIEAVNVVVNTTPSLLINNPPAVCTPSLVDLTAAAVTAGSTNVGVLSYWTDMAATGSLSTPNAIGTGGTYYIQANNSGCTVILPVLVTVDQTPQLIITDPVTVCSPTTVNITAAAVTTGSTNVGSLSYWTDVTAATPLATPSAVSVGGTYYIQANNAGCTDIEAVNVIITTTPVITDPADQTVCDSYTLPAISGTGLSGSEGYFTAPNGGGTQLAIGSSVTASQTLYIYAINGACFDEETVVVNVNYTPSIDPIANTTECATYTLPTITGTNLTGSESFYNNSQAMGGTVITGPITSSQTVWVYDADGSCSDETSFVVTIDPLPVVTAVTGGGDYCVGDVLNDIEVTVTGSNDWTIEYTLDGIAQTTTQSTSPISLGNVPGVYVVTGVTDANCTNSASGTQTIVVSPIPAEPTAGTDSLYCSSWTLTDMTVSGTGGTYTWYSDDQLTLVLGTGTTMMPIQVNGTNYYYVTETVNGCAGPADTVTITIQDCEIIVPTAFTPNGDGIHDTWEIVDLDEVYPNNVVTVYNRWGNMIYQSEEGNYNGNPWDGTYEGNALPVASYYFVIDFNDEDKGSQTGIISIVLDK